MRAGNVNWEARAMIYLLAIGGAFWQQWKTLGSGWNFAVGMVANVPIVAALAWVATQSNRSGVVGYAAIGLFLMTLWNQSQLGMRWSVYGEAYAGTLEFSLISRAPLMAFLVGKALAHALAAARPALAALIVALILAPEMPQVPNPSGLAISVLAATLGVLATAFIFAPLQVIAARQLDSVLSIRPFVIVLSGFLYPVSLLPAGVALVARIFPTSWAMDAVLLSLQGGASAEITVDVLAALGLSVLYLLVTWGLFQLVEGRVRATGALIT